LLLQEAKKTSVKLVFFALCVLYPYYVVILFTNRSKIGGSRRPPAASARSAAKALEAQIIQRAAAAA
jgi:hypothetical protein